MIEEPSYAKDAPKITDTLKIYKVVRKMHKMLISWLLLSISRSWTIPSRILWETGRSNFVGHDESSMQDENKCALCEVDYDDSSDSEWL